MALQQLQVVLTRSVMQELTVSSDLATEFWSVVIHLLRECGLAGQAWVSTTLKELAQIAEKARSWELQSLDRGRDGKHI